MYQSRVVLFPSQDDKNPEALANTGSRGKRRREAAAENPEICIMCVFANSQRHDRTLYLCWLFALVGWEGIEGRGHSR